MKTTATLRRLALLCAFVSPSLLLNSQTLFFSWADQFGGTGYDMVNNICTDNLGNVYSTGAFRNTVDFDPGVGTTNLVSGGVQDVFVTKVDANGSLLWAVRVGGTGIDQGSEIAIDANGYVYVAGSFEGTVDFNPGAGTNNLSSQANASSFILKLTAQGNYVWAKAIGSNQGTSAEGLSVSAIGVVHLGGNFAGVADLNPGAATVSATTSGNIDIYLVELDSAGNYVWGIDFGSTGLDGCAAVTEDVNGDVYMTGYFANTCDFDPTASTSNLTATGNDAFVAKYTSNGGFGWASKLGGGGTDGGTDIIVDFTGKVYTTGYFDGTADFDPGSGNVTFTAGTAISDAYVSCLTSSGGYSWAAQLGGASVDVGQSIMLDLTGNVYTTGRFSTTADFDPGAGTSSLTSSGVEDVFVSKLSPTGTFVSAHKFGASSNDNGLAIALDVNNNIFVAGYFNGSTDVDPQASVWTLTSNGQDDGYLVKLSQSGVGVEESAAGAVVNVFPNPTSGWITLTTNADVQDRSLVRVLSADGKLLFENYFNGSVMQIDMSAYTEGTYLVQVQNKNGTATCQVIR
jgi:hypothetical protein